MPWVTSLRATVERVRREVRVLDLACRDARTPWYAKVVAGVVVAYALSPLDLIPDFVPVLGYVDDAILIPLGVALVLRLVPPEVMRDCRSRAATEPIGRRRWLGGALTIAIWVSGACLIWHAYQRYG